jgi:transcriptional regulator GlxA family with amidase domain
VSLRLPYVLQMANAHARRMLEESSLGTEAVAVAAGFGSYEAMRRAFSLALDVSPSEYRRRFGAGPDAVVPESAQARAG